MPNNFCCQKIRQNHPYWWFCEFKLLADQLVPPTTHRIVVSNVQSN